MKKTDVFRKIVFLLSILVLMTTAAFAQNADKNEQGLDRKVVKEILQLPYYGVFDIIKIKVEDDTVTLLGQVMYPTTKEDAEKRVRKLEGVKEVKNEIEVLPLSRFDDRIRYRVWRSIANKGSLYRYLLGANPSLRIIVNDGRVSLEGFVNSKGDYDLAYIAAREVPGTFEVKNNLEIVQENKKL